MIRTIEVETNDDFEDCDNCIHDDDAEEICKMRGCIHAILEGDIKECYEPKEITMSKSELNFCLDSLAKIQKIKKIVNTPFCEREESLEEGDYCPNCGSFMKGEFE